MHYKKLFTKDTIGAWDLEKDATVEIEKVVSEELTFAKGEKEQKPCVYFVGAKKKLVLNITNAAIIAEQHGEDVDKWPGKKITLYATKTKFGRETVDCVRVREKVGPETSAFKGLEQAGQEGEQAQ
jgi:hypothetical protein